VHGDEEDPDSVSNALGSVVIGMKHCDDINDNSHASGFANSSHERQCYFAFRTQVKETTPIHVSEMIYSTLMAVR